MPNRLMPNTLKWGLIPWWNNRTLANSLMCRDRVIACDSIRHHADQSESTLCSLCPHTMWDIVTLSTKRGTTCGSLCWSCSWRKTQGSINTHLTSPVCLFTPPLLFPLLKWCQHSDKLTLTHVKINTQQWNLWSSDKSGTVCKLWISGSVFSLIGTK